MTYQRIELSDEWRSDSEQVMLENFLISALANGHAISDEIGVVTWATDKPNMVGTIETIIQIYRHYDVEQAQILKMLPPAAHQGFPSAPGFLYDEWRRKADEEYLRKAVRVITCRNIDHLDKVIIHETEDPSSAGISWGWLRRQTIVPASITFQTNLSKYIKRQERRVAEASSAQRQEPSSEEPDEE